MIHMDGTEIILKTPDGLEFKPIDDLKTPVRNEPQKKFSLGDFLRAD